MLFDEVLVQIGEFKKFQTICLLGGQYFGFLLGFGVTMLPVFILATPEHRCSIPGINDTWVVQDDAHERLINQTIPSGSKCTFYDHQDNGTEKTCNNWVYDDEIFVSTAIMEFNIVCERNIFRAFTNMCYFMGLLVGGLGGGRLSDRFGRKVVMYASVFPLMTSSIVLSFSPNIYVLMICRFVQSCCIMSYYAAAFVLFLEITGPSRRVLIAPVCDVIFSVGYVLMTVPAFYLRNWRHLCLLLGCLQLTLIPIWWLVWESPRWLLTMNRKAEAEKIIEKAARLNKKPIPKNILDKVEISVSSQDVSFWQMFKYRTTCVRLVIFGINWAAASTVYYGLSLNAGNLSGNIFVNFTLSAAIDIPAALFILFAPMKFGRRRTHVFCFLLSGGSLIATIIVVLVGNQETWPIQLLATIGKFGASAAFASCYVFTAELHPTAMRSISLGFCSMCARIMSLCAPFVSDLGEYIPGRFSKALPLVVFGILCTSAGLLSLLLPETHKRPLPTTLEEARNFTRQRINVKDDTPNGGQGQEMQQLEQDT